MNIPYLSTYHLIILILTLVIIGFLIYLFLQGKKKERALGSLDMTLFLVLMPKYEAGKEEKAQGEEKALISQMEQIYASFLYLRRPGFFKKLFRGLPKIAFEVASQIGGTDISFYVAVPGYLETGFEKYVQGVFPRAFIEKVPQDYTIFEPNGKTAGAYLKLTEPPIFPIGTYKTLEKDALATISNTLSKISPDEGAAIQVMVRPISQFDWKKRGSKILAKIREGKSVKTALSEASRPPVLEFLIDAVNIITGQSTRPKGELEEREEKEMGTDEKTVQAIQNKIQKQVFETNIRLLTSAQTQERAEEILSHLEGAFNQFSLFTLNGFKPREVRKRKLRKLVYNFSFRNFDSKQKNILNIEELTSIYHFPTHYIKTPYIKAAKTGAAPPPAELPEQGLVSIGKVNFRGEEKKVSFASLDDRRRHFYIIGQTGVGKSTLLKEMIRQDIQNGKGVAVIDPHGDLVEDVLTYVPKERVEDIVLFEPFDIERPMGLNMLEYDTPQQKDFAVAEMIAIWQKLYPSAEITGPMFEHYMRNAMLALMADQENPGTLVEIPRIFTDPEFMEGRIAKVRDPLVRGFWLKEWRQTTGETKSDMLGYVVSKVGRFIENEMMRNILGQPRSGFDLEKIMNGGKIFLANLSKGLTGETNTAMLGLILVSKMQMAAMRRAIMPEEQRKDFYLYIDEFQNFTTDSIATILSEARKYRLNLIMAHQYIPQLREEIKNAVLGNVGTIAAFRIGADDAEFLEKQFEPEFSRFDLVNLDNFDLIIKLMIENKITTPFKMQSPYPQKGNLEIVGPIKKISKLKYGRPKEIVEREIEKRSRLVEL